MASPLVMAPHGACSPTHVPLVNTKRTTGRNLFRESIHLTSWVRGYALMPSKKDSQFADCSKASVLELVSPPFQAYLFFHMRLAMYIYGVRHLRSGVTSAGRYVSEEGVSRWGTGWLFLGWKFASHPKLMILKTRVCRRAIAKVFRNFVGVCQTWTTKSPQSKQACSNLCLDKVFQLAGGGGQDETLVSHIVQFCLYKKLIQLPAVSLWRDWKVTYLTRTLRTVLSLRKCCPEKVPLPEAYSTCRESLTW